MARAAIAAAVALLLRHRAAVWLFGLSLAAIVVNDTYDIPPERRACSSTAVRSS
jgi:hypothetical protein